MTFSTFVRERASDFLDYDTPKFVRVRSKKIGAVCRVTQMLCLGYLVGYDLLYQKGYQQNDVGVSGVTTKVKGVQYSDRDGSGGGGAPGEPRLRVWDTADYMIPPHMNGAFFVMTNVLVTANQTQGKCSEDPTFADARCAIDADCQVKTSASVGNGAFTGRCLLGGGGSNSGNLSTAAAVRGVCEVTAWCPVENDTLTSPAPLLRGSRNFTVLIKNYVYFPYYGKYRSNIMETATKQYLRSCVYNAKTDPQCPIFKLGDVVDSIKGESYDKLALIGGVVSIRIDWDCDLDYSIKHCLPTYSFARLDSEATDALISQGYNFRFAYNFWEGGTKRRELVKAYGILFLVSVTANAGAFNVIPMMMSVGSGLGLLGVATVVCDFIVAHIYQKRSAIKHKKFDAVDRQSESLHVSAAAAASAYAVPGHGSSSPQVSALAARDRSQPPRFGEAGAETAEDSA